MSSERRPDATSDSPEHDTEIGQARAEADALARGLETERVARVAAEHVADQRRGLQEVAGALSRSLNPEAVARTLLDAALAALDAPRGWIATTSDDGAPATLLQVSGFPAGADPRAGRPTSGGRDDTTVVVGLDREGRQTGEMALAFDGPRTIVEDERWFLESLAAMGSQALERARLFAALADRDERLRFALQASSTGIWEWSVDDDRLTWSPEACQLHGMPPEAAPGTFGDYLALVHPQDRDDVWREVSAAARDGSPYDVEFRIVRPDGGVRWTRGAGRLVTGPDGPSRMLGTIVDVTDRREAEAERDRLVAAERAAAELRDAFIGVVSHELRTPITTIFGGTRVLARRWREMDPVARDDILADVVEESDRLYRLVEDLLVLTRVERGTLEIGHEPVHLARLVDRVVDSERDRWPGVSFEVEAAPDLPSAHGEDTYLEQVVRNLLGNAAKYGGAGTTVTVSCRADADAVTLCVQDQGPGIDEGELARVFELFYRSPEVSGAVTGAGIGLFVCRQLVSAMGGQIRAERRPEGGAAFLVTLPRYPDEDAS